MSLGPSAAPRTDPRMTGPGAAVRGAAQEFPVWVPRDGTLVLQGISCYYSTKGFYEEIVLGISEVNKSKV